MERNLNLSRVLYVALFALLAAVLISTAVGHPIVPQDVLYGMSALGVTPLFLGEVDLAEIAKEVKEQGTAWKEWRETNEALIKAKAEGKAVSDLEAKLAKIEPAFAKSEQMSQDLVAAQKAIKEAEAKAKETEAAVGELEGKLAKLALGNKQFDPKAQMKAWDTWGRSVVAAIATGEVNLTPEARKALNDVSAEWKAMSVQNDTTGGYLAPVEMTNEIIKTVTEMSPVRSLVRVRQTTMKALQLPKRTGQFAAVWVAEQGTRNETDGLRYGMIEIPNHEIYALIDISEQNLEDSAYNMGSEIQMEATEQFALAEGTAVVSGSGVGKPEGWLTNADVSTVNSGAALTITADGIFNLKAALKTAYTRNATFALNRTSLFTIRKLKDANGQYLWMPGLAQGRPNSIDGDPYVEVPDMESPGVAARKVVTYGDFLRAYTMVDRIQMVMLRDPFTQATSGNIRFIFRRRQGGKVVLPEAIKTMVCSA